MSSKIQLTLKRIIDILLSLIGLILLAIPFAAIALAIKFNSKGPVFFRQERVGKDGRIFRPWKFRTMIVGQVSKGLGYTVSQDDATVKSIVLRYVRRSNLGGPEHAGCGVLAGAG